MSDSVETKKTDYLEVDESIPGQNYVCLSFLSPEESTTRFMYMHAGCKNS